MAETTQVDIKYNILQNQRTLYRVKNEKSVIMQSHKKHKIIVFYH